MTGGSHLALRLPCDAAALGEAGKELQRERHGSQLDACHCCAGPRLTKYYVVLGIASGHG